MTFATIDPLLIIEGNSVRNNCCQNHLMTGETNYVSNRLLFTAEPFAHESFVGYLLRLCELNEFESPAWITELTALNTVRGENFNLFFDTRQKLETLAALSNVSISKIQSLLYQFNNSARVHPTLQRGEVIFQGNVISRYFIQREKARVCPACLREKSYLKQIWEFAPATCYPVHGILLIDVCPGCQKPLSWHRRKISLCNCGYDWREIKLAELVDKDVRITRQIYRHCQLLTDSNESCFNENHFGKYSVNRDSLSEHLGVLNLTNLLKVLFFIISYFKWGA